MGGLEGGGLEELVVGGVEELLVGGLEGGGAEPLVGKVAEDRFRIVVHQTECSVGGPAFEDNE